MGVLDQQNGLTVVVEIMIVGLICRGERDVDIIATIGPERLDRDLDSCRHRVLLG
jgi:hypothetical protein